jgi:hypothetical protein
MSAANTAFKRCSVRLYSQLFCKGVHVLFMLLVFIYVFRSPIPFPYQMMFVSFNSYLTYVTSQADTADSSEAPELTSSI